MADVDQLQQWWGALTEDQQERLKQAVKSYPADSSVVGLLTSTGCPIQAGSWTQTSWTSVPGSEAVSLHGPLATFIEKKADDED